MYHYTIRTIILVLGIYRMQLIFNYFIGDEDYHETNRDDFGILEFLLLR